MRQAGATFLEVIVVVAILMIAASFISPAIGNWRQKRALESDYQAVLSQVDYLKTRARTLNGTAALICLGGSGVGTVLTYQISAAPQNSTAALGSSFASNIVEDPSSKNTLFNILSGNSKIVSTLCNGLRGIFISTGQSGIEGSGSAIDIEIDPTSNKNIYGAYRILLNQSTGFIQKFKWSTVGNSWVELD